MPPETVTAVFVILNALGTVFTPSEALIVKLYVVSDETVGIVPEITPVEELRESPAGKDDPLAREYVTESVSVTERAEVDMLEPLKNVPSDPDAVFQTVAAFETKLNVLGTTGLTPSDALIVKVYVVFDETSGGVPEIKPVDEFKVTPEGNVDPLANAYVIAVSSVAVAETDIETLSWNDPRDPLGVVQTGFAFIYSASGINPNKFDGFVTLMSYGS